MTIAYSNIPAGYDVDFIARHCGIQVTGFVQLQDGSTQITYRNPDGSGNFEMVSQTIDNYAVEYLPVALTSKISEISSLRNEKIQAFTFMGMTVVLDIEAKANIVGAVAGLDRNPDVPGVDWSLGGGSFVFLPRYIVYGLADASFLYIENCFTTSKELVATCKACADINELAAVDITQGWPQGS